MLTWVFFGAGNHGSGQNFDPSLLTKKLTDFYGDYTYINAFFLPVLYLTSESLTTI